MLYVSREIMRGSACSCQGETRHTVFALISDLKCMKEICETIQSRVLTLFSQKIEMDADSLASVISISAFHLLKTILFEFYRNISTVK